MKNILTKYIGIILSVIFVILILTGILFREEVKGTLFSIILAVFAILIPLVFILDYIKKIKRINYLEETLKANNIPFSSNE